MKGGSVKREMRQRGSVLVVAVVMLGMAMIIVAGVHMATMANAWNAERTYHHDKAVFLADTGLRAALIKMNAVSDGAIAYAESRNYLSRAEAFRHPDWGFATGLVSSNGQTFLVSRGRYNDQVATVQCAVEMGSGARLVHALYAHALFAGNDGGDEAYILKVGGAGTAADFVKGDTYSGGSIEVSGSATLRHPELLVDVNGDGICEPGETWTNAYAVQTFSAPLSKADFDAYKASMSATTAKMYTNGKYDPGEAFVDTIGNGIYDEGEPYVDANGNGKRDMGDSYIDRNSNGVYNVGVDTVIDYGNGKYDVGENWVEDSAHSQRINGKYDPAGGYYLYSYGAWRWKTSYTVGYKSYSCASWPAEEYEDAGDGEYDESGEAFTDRNGVYDPGEEYFDDRNSIYDYGTQATKAITGMPAPGPGQLKATGYDDPIDPPNLTNMFYGVAKTGTCPKGALPRWGHDVAVTATDYGAAKAIVSPLKPEHIFIRNPPTSGSTSSGGKTIYGRSYTPVVNAAGKRQDDYFLEDPADPSYNTYVSADSIDGTVYTAPMYIDVRPEHNDMLYFVDGNVYIHNPQVYSMRFRRPGTRITIVANGNITISDEFCYNADYASGLTRSAMNSTVVRNPSDILCLIAMKNPAFPGKSGNIYIGDAQFGTGGSIHSLLYAENDFVDNNLNTVDQGYISVFGNMTAGNQVRLNRSTSNARYRTRLDVTLDERVRDGEVVVPGLPYPVGVQRSIMFNTAWQPISGTWSSFSHLQ